jgi:uncharacterized membrane protein YfcA
VTPLAIAAIVALGAVSGFSSGLVGTGGTYLTLTLLAIVLGDAHSAVGTTLVYALVIASWASIAHVRNGRFSPALALWLGLPSALTAAAGAWIAEQLPDRTLSLGVAVLTGVVALVTVAGRKASDRVAEADFRATRATYAGAVAGGLGLGLLKGVFGIGGGFLLLPYMVVVLRVPTRLAVACSLVAGIPGAIVGGAGHLLLGNVHPIALAALLAGALPLTWAGAAATGRVPAAALRHVFLGLLTVSGCALIALPG